MKEEKVFFKNKKGQKLAGAIYTPEKYNSSVVFVNGIGTLLPAYTRGKKYNWLPKYAKQLAQNYKVLTFDYYGRGGSGGQWTDLNMTSALLDLEAAVNFLNTKNIGLIGESFGGGVSLAFAARDSRVKSLSTLYAAYSLDEWGGGSRLAEAKKKGYTITPNRPSHKYPLSLFGDIRKYKILENTPKITAPILITHGYSDTSVSVEQAKELYAAANKPKKILILSGEDHVYSREGFKKAFDEIFMWFKKYLK